MKRFLIQIAVLSILVVVSFILILARANGYTDAFYTRFTTPQQSNLILGTSRAAQGLQPVVLQGILDRSFFNYSFTIAHSPYGPTYLESIKKKLDTRETRGIFILTVDPWSISSTTPDPNDSVHFRELDLCLGNTTKVNRSPNFTYLFRNLKGKYHELLFQKRSGMFLHENGWLEVPVKMDSSRVVKRIADRVKMYEEDNLPYYNFSDLRLEYLKMTIEYLKNHGQVFLVRLPIHPDMMAVEELLMPDFNTRIEGIAPLTDGYIDMTQLNSDFNYTDGNHLYIDSGKEASRMIAQWILGR